MLRLSRSPTDPAFVQDPYRFYAEARARGPMHWWDEYGMPAVFSHAGVSALLRDRRFGRAAPEGFAPEVPPTLARFMEVEAHSMLELEPPRHTRLRGLVLRAFTSRRIAALGPEIATLAQRLAADLPGDAPFDLIDRFAEPLPVIVIARLLGVPEEMAPQLLDWSHRMVAVYQARRTEAIERDASAAAGEFADFLRGHVAHRRTRPADDLITHLVAAEEDGERLTTDEMISTCILLLNAGHEATVHTIGNGVKAMLEGDFGAEVLTPDRIEDTVEEILRRDPPLHMFTRWALEDAEVLGHRFARGDRVALLLGAANRDPALRDDPDRFDPARPVRQHTAFGGGLHFCVGAPLARLELQIALPALFARFPALRIVEPPRYADLYHFHGLERLMLAQGGV